MGNGVFFGGSVVAATVAGAVALFAPCCISVMLPAYFATAFQNRRALVAMTFLFAAGLATVILPIAMGAQVLQRTFTSQHTLLYTAMGAMLLALGAYTLLGGKIHLPMPGRRAGGKAGPLSIYTLGIFSGVTSSCCAPVLAGVLALSGVASSFGAALGLGSAYVLGMVAPLFVISLLWERLNWRSSRLFRPRTWTLRLGPVRRSVTPTALASGVLLTLMGGATLVVGLTSNSMPSGRGWQADLSSHLQHYGKVLTDAISFVPSWVAAVILAGAVLALGGYALRQVAAQDAAEPPGAADDATAQPHPHGAEGAVREPEYA